MSEKLIPLRHSNGRGTDFAAVAIEFDNFKLWIDGNSKITAGNGSFAEPAPNAFSLVEIADCPGSTPTCREACYVHGLKANAPDIHALYEHNSREIRRALSSLDSYWTALNAVSDWIGDNCAGGFRWHVSGDVFSRSYAKWIWRVAALSPNVNHWIYTRSFDFVDALVGLPNLAVNLSADRDNYRASKRTHAKYPETRICWLAKSPGDVPNLQDDDSVIFPDYPTRKGGLAGEAFIFALNKRERRMICPVDYFGKSEHVRCGPCKKCLRPST